MIRRISFIAILLLTLVIAGLQADEREDLLAYYDSTFMTVGYDFLGGITLNYQGQSTNIERGIPFLFQNPLLEYEYSRKNKLGNRLSYGGLSLVLASAFVPVFFLPALESEELTPDTTFWTGYYFAISGYTIGLIATIIGESIHESGKTDLLQGVNLYNRKKAEEF